MARAPANQMKVVAWPLDKPKPYEKNPRKITELAVQKVAASIEQAGWRQPIVVDENGVIVAGHTRLRAAKLLKEQGKAIPGWPDNGKVPVHPSGMTAEEAAQYRLSDNRVAEESEWDKDMLRIELQQLEAINVSLPALGFEPLELRDLGLDGYAAAKVETEPGALTKRFGAAPFSVLSAREGWWQERKRAWLALGIDSEVGRDDNLLKMSDTMRQPDPGKRPENRQHSDEYEGGDAWAASGTSIFDPVLCELVYRWFCPPKGTVLDPFAGGSVRGIVASQLNRRYVGVELRAEQVKANEAQRKAAGGGEIVWHNGDSANIAEICKGEKADLLFSCPPYADLEVYSKQPGDLSNMPYPEFRAAYQRIIAESCKLLKADSFACFVVGEVRSPKNKHGGYYGFVQDTIEGFVKAGLSYYNEAILVTAVGSLALRAGRAFEVSRKLGKTHQNVLVFCKGDPRAAAARIGQVEMADVPMAGSEDEYGERVSLGGKL